MVGVETSKKKKGGGRQSLVYREAGEGERGLLAREGVWEGRREGSKKY